MRPVGQGFHERAGEPHAEVRALNQAGERARGATLYCTLEPCCHVGRTGPCVHRIVGAGVARVVASMEDPNPAVQGRGFAYLRASDVRYLAGTVNYNRDRTRWALTDLDALAVGATLGKGGLVFTKIAEDIYEVGR